MPDKLHRLIEKAKTERRKAKRGKAPSDAILIMCDRPEDVPRRIDVLIAAGKITEAERPRCVFWEDPAGPDMMQDEWVLMMDKNTTADDSERREQAWSDRVAAVIGAHPAPAAARRKIE
jgi:hypothetical protein